MWRSSPTASRWPSQQHIGMQHPAAMQRTAACGLDRSGRGRAHVRRINTLSGSRRRASGWACESGQWLVASGSKKDPSALLPTLAQAALLGWPLIATATCQQPGTLQARPTRKAAVVADSRRPPPARTASSASPASASRRRQVRRWHTSSRCLSRGPSPNASASRHSCGTRAYAMPPHCLQDCHLRMGTCKLLMACRWSGKLHSCSQASQPPAGKPTAGRGGLTAAFPSRRRACARPRPCPSVCQGRPC